MVLPNSQVALDVKCNGVNQNKQRQDMLKAGEITGRDEKYYLMFPTTFNSPSAVADFVIGGSNNGWVEWKNKDKKTLDEIERKEKKYDNYLVLIILR